jgi:hypothetical protein
MPAHCLTIDDDIYTTMTSLDIGLCLDHARAIDPFRGTEWLAAFEAKAEALGYVFIPQVGCVCQAKPHHADCGKVKPLSASPSVWPHDDTLHGILNLDRLPSEVAGLGAPPELPITRAPSAPPLPRIPKDAPAWLPGEMVESDPDVVKLS